MKCDKCNYELHENMDKCPRCSEPCNDVQKYRYKVSDRVELVLDVPSRQRGKGARVLAIVLAIVFILIVVGLLCFDSAAMGNNMEDENSYTIDELLACASTLEAQRVEQIAHDLEADMDLNDLARLVPYLSQKYIDDFVRTKIDGISIASDISFIAPYVGGDVLDIIAKKLYSDKGLLEIAVIAPYLGQDVIDECVINVYKQTKKLQDIACISHYVSKHTSNIIAEDALKSYDKQAIKIILPLTDQDILD